MFEESSIIDGPASESKSRENYRVYSNEIAPKLVAPWSSPEESKFLFKRRYVSASGSLPQRNKRFVRYKISRSLNFDASTSHNSSSDSGSFHEDKHLTRSAKIMRALNFNSSPSYYGRTKIKRSLNFNLTPSPKRFSRTVKNVRKASRLSSSTSPLATERKLLHSDENTSGSGNGSLMFSSAESIDENQNETPSRQFTKTGSPLNYSTPRNKLSENSPSSSTFTPLLRSDFKRRIENIICVSSTPSQQSIKSSNDRSDTNEDEVVVSTPRNLFRDFSDADDDRPRTPENLIRLVPESMSAIKKSHKKERSSKRNERCVTQSGSKSQSLKNSNASQMESPELSQLANSTSTPLLSRKYSRPGHYPMYDVQAPTEDETGDDIHHSEDDLSETGSIFDYKSEREAKRDLDEGQMNVDKDSIDCAELSAETSEREKTEEEMEILPEHPRDTKRTVTPENRVNYLQYVLRDSIKKSHKKIKDDNKKKLFSPKVLGLKFGPPKSEKTDEYSDEREHCRRNSEERGISAEPDILIERVDRAVTPEKINSSRLLLSQFNSVKKSHKKDKHSKILSGFMKRQEYFNRDLESAKDFQKRTMSNQDACKYKSSTEDISSESDYAMNIRNIKSGDVEVIETGEVIKEEALSPDKISSLTKRKNLLDELNNSVSSNVSCESDVQELEVANAGGSEFRIFTPLKRRRPLTSSFVKEYSCAYLVPSEKDGLSEEAVVDITLSRCLTPIAKFEDLSPRLEENNSPVERMEEEVTEQQICSSNGRSTPRNMSTRALYCGMDSIKKSHKKNKRGSENGTRKLVLSSSTSSQNSKEENSVDLLEMSRLNSTMDSMDSYHADKSDAAESSMPGSSEELVDDENSIATATVNTSTEALPTKTPPKYLRTKDYIRLVGNTSIKRSHKKVRQQKRYGEPKTDAQELSDDGSIFDDNEKITNSEVD